MARNLYRFYLYAVSIALLIFAASGIGRLLSTLLSFTPLRGESASVPAQEEVVQSVVFAVLALLVAVVLGGLHYWLIRRDMHSDPEAGNSAIRAFFLNITETIGILSAVPMMGFSVLELLGTYPQAGVAGTAAFSLAALAVVGILALERRRTQVISGAALNFQRFHFYVVQVFLLLYLVSAWSGSVRPIIDALFFGSGGFTEYCRDNRYCADYNTWLLAVTVLWFVAFSFVYGWMLRTDKSLILRLILHGGSLALGAGIFLAGLHNAFRLALTPLFTIPIGLKDVLGPGAEYDFATPLLLGVLVVAGYHWWLRYAVRQNLLEQKTLFLIECAIVAALAAGSFWWGCGMLIHNALQTLVPVPEPPEAQSWMQAISFVLTGIGYWGLDFYLHRRYRTDLDHAASPRRAFVYVLLGGGILGFAIGGAVALYAWGTSLLGSPIDDWEQVARVGLSAFIVGAVLVGIYLWTARREQLFAHVPASIPASTPTAPQPATVEEILDDLLASKITRDEAAERIKDLSTTTS